MKHLIYLFIIFCIPIIGLCQLDTVCEKLFIKVEVLPDFKNGQNAFEDSLTLYLKRNKIDINDGRAVFEFTVTVYGEVRNLYRLDNTLDYADKIKEALLTIPNLWIPAMQNGHIVCSSIKLRVDVVDKTIHVMRFQ